MKLELVKKIGFITPALSAICIDEHTAVFLSYGEEQRYQILWLSSNGNKIIDLGYTEKYYQLENSPVLFAMDRHFGVIRDKNEIWLYSEEKQKFEIIIIKNSETLPQRFRLSWKSSISDCSVLPICFNQDGLGVDTRYIALLHIDVLNQQAYWKSCLSLETQSLPHHKDHHYPPKVDTVMLKDDELYIFSSGGQVASVNKWGMDYYAFIKSDLNGKVIETFIDSGDLHSIDQKKRGINGLLSSSQQYLMLTPVFQNDEWKGKQKIFSIITKEISDIIFPRGFGKYSQVIQHFGEFFWVYSRVTQELVICKEK